MPTSHTNLNSWVSMNISIKAHFTLGIKAKVQIKSNIPISAIIEISLDCFGWKHTMGDYIILLQVDYWPWNKN